ncbi:CBS domain-containing protein [Streptosporangium sp. NPDC000396]|uniref:CBS domain-containing protein n=1 Tax=Streptosporangium sp. NPDC000396 TaxID=3366185 RepID=UPI0036A12CC3
MGMKVNEVMNQVAIAVRPDVTFADLVEVMRRFQVGAVTVIDGDRRPVGVVSEDDLLLKETASHGHGDGFLGGRRRREERRKATGGTAGEIMSSPAITVTMETPVRDAAQLMHRNRIKQLPVVDPVTGKITGTVHQSDLLKIFRRPAEDIRREIAETLERLHVDSTKLTVGVETGVVTLMGQVPRRSQIVQAVAAVHGVDGVLEVKDDLTFGVDDMTVLPSLYL